jgi:hypothetical protein
VEAVKGGRHVTLSWSTITCTILPHLLEALLELGLIPTITCDITKW